MATACRETGGSASSQRMDLPSSSASLIFGARYRPAQATVLFRPLSFVVDA